MFDIYSIHCESLGGDSDGLLAEQPEGVEGGGQGGRLGEDDGAVEQGHGQHRALGGGPGVGWHGGLMVAWAHGGMA